jgi:hypothetical protein
LASANFGGVRRMAQAGAGALVLITMMLLGGLVLWVGIPLGWLWVGGQVQGSGGSIGTALLVMAAGVVMSIAALIPVLGWLNRKYGDLREARGLEPLGNVALEGVLAVSAGIALIAFAIWFLLFAGTSPVPLNLST